MNNLDQLPVDVFIQQITYLPFKDVVSLCSTNTTLRKYCTEPKYRNKWKRLIDSTFQNVYGYQDKLSEIWNQLNLEPDTYNYLVYTKLIHLLDPITQLMIYYRQGDMDSFNQDTYNKTQRFLALFLLGEKRLIEQYLPSEAYMPFIHLMKDKKISPDDLNNMMIEMAIQGNVLGTTVFLEQGADIHAKEDLALRQASKWGQLDVVKLLLDRGANIHSRNDGALHEASQEGHLDVIKLLLDRGANIHSQNDWALRWASREGNLDMVRLLLNRGADVHADNGEALLWASLGGYRDVVELLLDRGANIHVQNDRALRVASKEGHLDVVELLLDRGADVHADNDGALRMARYRGHQDIVQLLLERGTEISVTYFR
jgi:hypothetical protein